MRRNPSILAAARRFIQRSSCAASTCGEPTVSTHEAPVVPLCAMVRLRRDPSAGRRAAGIVAVCVVGAALVVFAFRGCVLYELSVNGALAGELANVDESFGSVWAQIAIDAVLMAAVCLAVDAVARYFGHAAAARSLRTVYRGWLMLVVLVAFMVTAAVGYVVVTFQEEQAADELMGSEVAYLCNQIDENQERLEAFARIVGEGFVARDGSELSDEAREFVDGPLSLNRLLDGYTEEFDGMVVVVKDGAVLLTDTDQFKAGVSIDVFFGEGSEPILSEYASEGRLVQLVYSDEDMLDPSEEDRIYSLQIAYLRVGQVDDYLVLMIQPASMVFADRAGVMVWLTLSALVLLLVVFAASSRLLVRIVADPIDRVNRALERIAEGDLATRTDKGSSRELASLSEGVNTMTVALEKQFSQIKEGIKRELDAAAVIQESALPRAFPPFPDIPRFDIYAGMQPAREVGGDFYDFFLIGDACNAESGKLGFIVAVSVLTGESTPEERRQVMAELTDGSCDIVLTTPEFLAYHADEHRGRANRRSGHPHGEEKRRRDALRAHRRHERGDDHQEMVAAPCLCGDVEAPRTGADARRRSVPAPARRGACGSASDPRRRFGARGSTGPSPRTCSCPPRRTAPRHRSSRCGTTGRPRC